VAKKVTTICTEYIFNLIKISNDRDLRMKRTGKKSSGENSKLRQETKTISVPLKTQFSDYHPKAVAKKMHTEE
jgi:hypothetical protein